MLQKVSRDPFLTLRDVWSTESQGVVALPDRGLLAIGVLAGGFGNGCDGGYLCSNRGRAGSARNAVLRYNCSVSLGRVAFQSLSGVLPGICL